MKFLMVSNCGEGAHILREIQREGNDVSLYIAQEDWRKNWEGLLPKVEEISPDQETIVIFDFSGFGEIADELKSRGIPVVGGSSIADRLEQDRMFGLNFMEEAGIRVPFTANFVGFNLSEIREFLGENGRPGKRWVFKPSGKDLPCSLTYCSHDDEDLIKWAEYCDKHFGKDIEEFVLQEFKEGVCVSSEYWCDGTKFVRPANHTVEVKKFMNDELGQATGCSGNLVWAERNDQCRILSQGVKRLEEAMVSAGHVGPVDLNVVANDEGVWGLEFTCRFGYSATPTLMKMIRGGLGKFFANIALGQAEMVEMESGLASAVRLTVPPYPAEGELKDLLKVFHNEGIPIRGVEPEERVHFYEVMEEDGQLVHAPGMGVIADVVGFGQTPDEAFREPYAICDKALIPNKQYRTDLSHCLGAMFEQVKQQELM